MIIRYIEFVRELFRTYPSPSPVMVTLVPPAVPPLLGDTSITSGVRLALYLYQLDKIASLSPVSKEECHGVELTWEGMVNAVLPPCSTPQLQ